MRLPVVLIRPFIRSVLFLTILLLPVVLSSQKKPNDVSIDDDSDWWSIIRQDSPEENLKADEKDVQGANFRILGITVGRDEMDAIQAKLGKVAIVTRGDAAIGRQQICYQSLDGKTYLTFESGEVQYAFYLFLKGPDWTGSELCAKSKFVTSGVSTLSGLRLGENPTQVRGILGKPTKLSRAGDLIYFSQIRKRWTPAELKRIRKYNPDVSDFYDMSAYIVARFSHSKLIYLGVSKSETD